MLAFEFDPDRTMDFTILQSQVKSILAMVRATFVLACRHIPVQDIGIFTMSWHSPHAEFCWTIQAGTPASYIGTSIQIDDRGGVLHKDYRRL